MRLESENRPAIEHATDRQVRSTIKALRSFGPSSFASLTAADGSYLQVAGGGITCTLEWRDQGTARHYRAHDKEPSRIHPDGTILAFGRGQEVRLQSDEWLTADTVADAFCSFLVGKALPENLGWREITEMLR